MPYPAPPPAGELALWRITMNGRPDPAGRAYATPTRWTAYVVAAERWRAERVALEAAARAATAFGEPPPPGIRQTTRDHRAPGAGYRDGDLAALNIHHAPRA